ncbi:hypothetical protein TKK_0015204 [Trichogramma kaykai]
MSDPPGPESEPIDNSSNQRITRANAQNDPSKKEEIEFYAFNSRKTLPRTPIRPTAPSLSQINLTTPNSNSVIEIIDYGKEIMKIDNKSCKIYFEDNPLSQTCSTTVSNFRIIHCSRFIPFIQIDMFNLETLFLLDTGAQMSLISIKEEVNKQVQEMLDSDVIEKSDSPYNNPLWIVEKKPDSEGNKWWRIVLDFRALNDKMISDTYPLPNITEIFDQVGSARRRLARLGGLGYLELQH